MTPANTLALLGVFRKWSKTPSIPLHCRFRPPHGGAGNAAIDSTCDRGVLRRGRDRNAAARPRGPRHEQNFDEWHPTMVDDAEAGESLEEVAVEVDCVLLTARRTMEGVVARRDFRGGRRLLRALEGLIEQQTMMDDDARMGRYKLLGGARSLRCGIRKRYRRSRRATES